MIKLDIIPPSRANAITKEYYNFLVGEINRGVTAKRVAKVLISKAHDYYSYHLITV